MTEEDTQNNPDALELSQRELVLRYSHNVIDHLGLKLYQNRPTRVIAELISNSWDADADHAWINMSMNSASIPDSERWIAVHDNGTGMSRSDLSDRFLVIGAPKRREPSERSQGGRRLMGRKGIGKLAPFGIAKSVDVVTISEVEGATESVYWLHLDLGAIKNEAAGVLETATYAPKLVVENGTITDIVAHSADETNQVGQFYEFLREHNSSTGTLILLRDLTLKRAIPQTQLIESLGRRFTATLERGFKVLVGETVVEVENSLPNFEYRIPGQGTLEEELPDGNKVKYWVGFVKSADWPQDSAGVGVYSHGKICQDRPFTFGVKGKEIFSRYMYGVVEADWLDEHNEDLISTDRTSVNWDEEHLKPLQEWGKRKVKLLSKLHMYMIPESLNLAVVFAQRAFALTKLTDLVHNGREVDLQKLLEQFPWIIDPDSTYLTANKTLKRAVEEAEKKGLQITGRRPTSDSGVPEANKPDFVFLSSPDETKIVVVELKNPQNDLTLQNRAQLEDYLRYFEAHYPNADRQGYLVGRVPNSGLDPQVA